jgi:hypothetical protein
LRQLSHSEIEAVLERKCSWILRTCAQSGVTPARIIAFGSAGRGELREDLWPLDLLFYTSEEFESRADSGGVCMLIRDEGRVMYDAERES